MLFFTVITKYSSFRRKVDTRELGPKNYIVKNKCFFTCDQKKSSFQHKIDIKRVMNKKRYFKKKFFSLLSLNIVLFGVKLIPGSYGQNTIY